MQRLFSVGSPDFRGLVVLHADRDLLVPGSVEGVARLRRARRQRELCSRRLPRFPAAAADAASATRLLDFMPEYEGMSQFEHHPGAATPRRPRATGGRGRRKLRYFVRLEELERGDYIELTVEHLER